MFLKIGITLEDFSNVGKDPEEKERLNRKESGIVRSCLIRLSILIGMLCGPEDLLEDKELIILRTSTGRTGLRKIELGLRLLR